MDLKRVAKDTTRVLVSYLTYQAVRTVIDQLNETNKPLGFWLHHFSAQEKMQDGERYLRGLLQENQELAFRVMTVREHLATEVAEFLPEMLCSGVAQANMDLRRAYLERISGLQVNDSMDPLEDAEDRGALE